MLYFVKVDMCISQLRAKILCIDNNVVTYPYYTQTIMLMSFFSMPNAVCTGSGDTLPWGRLPNYPLQKQFQVHFILEKSALKCKSYIYKFLNLPSLMETI